MIASNQSRYHFFIQIMERKIGEVFEDNGKTIEVIEDSHFEECDNCYYSRKHFVCLANLNLTGICRFRSDLKWAFFRKKDKDEIKQNLQDNAVCT